MMNRLLFFFIAFQTAIGLLFDCPSVVADNRPNILLVMVDDMGYSDIGCYGSWCGHQEDCDPESSAKW